VSAEPGAFHLKVRGLRESRGDSVWFTFYVMDRFWYHELLRAAVAYAEELDSPAAEAGVGVPLTLSSKIREKNRAALDQVVRLRAKPESLRLDHLCDPTGERRRFCQHVLVRRVLGACSCSETLRASKPGRPRQAIFAMLRAADGGGI
jgi:hypothetical protein